MLSTENIPGFYVIRGEKFSISGHFTPDCNTIIKAFFPSYVYCNPSCFFSEVIFFSGFWEWMSYSVDFRLFFFHPTVQRRRKNELPRRAAPSCSFSSLIERGKKTRLNNFLCSSWLLFKLAVALFMVWSISFHTNDAAWVHAAYADRNWAWSLDGPDTVIALARSTFSAKNFSYMVR